MVEEGVVGVVEVTKEVLMGDGGLVLLDEVLFKEVLMVVAGLVLLSAIILYDDYEAIVMEAMR